MTTTLDNQGDTVTIATMPMNEVEELEQQAARLQGVALEIAAFVDDLRTCAADYEAKCQHAADAYDLDISDLLADVGDRAFVTATQWIAAAAVDTTGTQTPAHVADLSLTDLRLVTTVETA
jgi:type IV secretory pathway TrbF-like protein